ncbi:MAG: flippase [Planctomycetota bacterium]
MARSTPVILAGNVLNTFLLFLLIAVIARYVDQGEFGFFCLGLAIAKFLSVLSGMGLQGGLPRYISCQLAEKEYRKAWSSVVSSFVITSLLGLFCACLLFLNADLISRLLHKPQLAGTIKIMALSVPFMALIELLVSCLRAVRQTGGRLYFQHLLRPLAAIILLFLVIVWRLSYTWVVWAYNISFVITLIALLFYAKAKILEFIPIAPYSGVTREIVSFSLPLLGATMLSQIVVNTDTLILACFKSAESVGIYNSALRLALLVPIISTSAGFIYLPVASHLFSRNRIEEISRTYGTITKWTFIVTLPFFLHVFLAPDLVLRLFFGEEYISASLALRILCLGYFVHASVGLNGMTCISLGKVGVFLLCGLMLFLMNVILDVLLIPKHGIVGASIASSVSIVLANVALTGYVYRYSGIHPFSRGYVKMIVFAIGIGIITFVLPIKHYLGHNILLILFFLGISLIGILATRSLGEEDASLIGYIEARLTNKTRFTDRFVRRFISRR